MDADGSLPDASDPDRILGVGLAPTPFTAAEIRAGCPDGRTITTVATSGEGTTIQVIRFGPVDDVGAEQHILQFDMVDKWKPRVVSTSWIELQGHASYPAAGTRISRVVLESPLGRLSCFHYTVDQGDSVGELWFDVDRPGMPVKLLSREGDGVVYSLFMVSDTGPAVGQTT